MSASFDISSYAYAHRGLWGPKATENSLPAFRAAAASGTGCELDVRMLKDGALVVFHDATLHRMCGDPRRLDEITATELAVLHLPDGSRIPSLGQVLDAMDGLPALIEIKIDPPQREITENAMAFLARSDAPAAVMSFDEPTVRRLTDGLDRRGSDRSVGQLIESLEQIGAEEAVAKAKRAIDMGVDYLAPHLSSLEAVAAAAPGLPLVTWTVRDPVQLDRARTAGAVPIFEGFPPDLAKPNGTPI